MTIAKPQPAEKYSAPALSKGLDILELLASRSTGMKKTEIAKSLDRSVSEIFRMLAVLVDRDYVSIDEASEQYTLTLKMFELSHSHPPIKRLTTVAADVMAELADMLNQSIHLSILHGTNILVIAQNDPPGNNITSVRLGARIPLTQTASGAVLVSQLSKARLTAICTEIENTPKTQIEIFRNNVAQAKQDGVCVAPSMVIAGVQNISVPIRDYSGDIVASLTIPFIQRLISTTDPDLETAKGEMMSSAKNISNLLGMLSH